MKKRDLASQIEVLQRRMLAIETAEKRRDHVHEWRYGKTVSGSEGSFSGRWTMWWWECEKAEVCGLGKASTNALAHVPDHFPASVR